jgi:hypothetical protein
MKLDPGMHIGLHLVFFGKTGVTRARLVSGRSRGGAGARLTGGWSRGAGGRTARRWVEQGRAGRVARWRVGGAEEARPRGSPSGEQGKPGSSHG